MSSGISATSSKKILHINAAWLPARPPGEASVYYERGLIEESQDQMQTSSLFDDSDASMIRQLAGASIKLFHPGLAAFVNIVKYVFEKKRLSK
jgi:hypothetical protein